MQIICFLQIFYLCDGQTDGQTYRQKKNRPPSTMRLIGTRINLPPIALYAHQEILFFQEIFEQNLLKINLSPVCTSRDLKKSLDFFFVNLSPVCTSRVFVFKTFLKISWKNLLKTKILFPPPRKKEIFCQEFQEIFFSTFRLSDILKKIKIKNLQNNLRLKN